MSTLAAIVLTWHRLRRLEDFPETWCSRRDRATTELYKLKFLPSVYIWGFQHQKKFIPYYVGQTPRPFERAMQHYSNLRGGLYPVYHRNCLSEFYLHKDDHKINRVNPNADHGMLYSPASPYALGTRFLNPNVQREVAYMLETFRFTYAVLPTVDKKEDRRQRERVERALACQLGRDVLQSTVARCTACSKCAPETARCHTGADPDTWEMACWPECQLKHAGHQIVRDLFKHEARVKQPPQL